ncbi:MAG: hypothetical protein GDA41_03890 [Rhodospirillales bacterium]|nr:hypothetical protein [Rhodospirillales bacterium]
MAQLAMLPLHLLQEEDAFLLDLVRHSRATVDPATDGQSLHDVTLLPETGNRPMRRYVGRDFVDES